MRKLLLLLGAVLMGGGVLAGAEHLRVDATRRGFLIKSENADITTMTSVIVCVPPFREKHFYNVTDDIDLINSEERAGIVQKGVKNKVDIVDYSVSRDGESLILSLVADLTHSDPTDMENTLLVTPEYLLSDADYTATLADGSEVSGHIPPTFEGEIEVRHVFENAVKASFTNKYGTLELEVLSGPPFLVGDRRGVVFEERRCFWIGHQVPMFEGQRYDSKVKLTFTKADNLSTAKPSATAPEALVKSTDAADTVIDYNFDYPLYPAPKAVEFYKNKPFVPAETLSFRITGGNDERLNRAAERIFGGWGINLVSASDDAQLDILISAEGEGIMVPPENPEGYLLKVGEDGIKIYSRTAKGAFYALQTLRGLYRDNAFKSALIRDWPDMEMRAVHFMLPDRDAYALLSRMITEVMAPMKMNMFIMECEFVHWESIPELHVKWGMTKEDCEKLIALCEENFIEPIPLMQTLSHMPWLFSNGQNLDMCEDTRNPYAYFTSHPDLYPLMEKVFDEVVETFHNPRYLHIGHDELYTWAQYPCRPESIAIGTEKLVYDDVMWYYNYAKKHNAQIMMWHDIFVTPEESPENGHGGGAPDWVDRIRPDLPRDIVFCVWRYAGKTTEFLDLEHLAAEGFEVAGSSWFEINNVERLTLETKRVGGIGMISTTWIYPILEGDKIVRGCFNALENWFIQVAPYTRSGAWSWNCNAKANAGLNGKELFASLLEGSRNRGVMSGKLLDLNGVANIGLNRDDKPFLIDELYGFDMLKPGKVRVGRVLFDIPAKGESAGIIALKSRLNPEFPEKVTINLDNVKCDEFYFLNTALGIQPPPESVVANYIITYADGQEAVLPVRYQYEVAPPEEDVNYFLSTGNRLNWKFGTQNMSLFYSTFVNPRPDVPVKSITIAGTEEEYPFYVFGISLGDKAE